MVPPAPVTFSTTTCWPSVFDIGPAISRATVSDGPPAWKGDTMVTKRLGKSWAWAAGVTRSATARQGIVLICGPPDFAWRRIGPPRCLCPSLHHHHQHDTERLLAPARRNGGAHRALDGFPDRIGVAPAR